MIEFIEAIDQPVFFLLLLESWLSNDFYRLV